ncbi:MAG: tRNA (adenosine(37)-N6)-dimethylallyltransferase MiaA [Verrucomicrobia bacterium]|nr:tRNA (adenosine(37)-N6)-dimethylallyltransferase MiaA [Verrucomicrobiota bacterium]
MPAAPVSLEGVILLGGPTATGKSAVASLLAERVQGEIISADSMQVFRGLDIGAAKASLDERSRVPHHLVDVVGLTESFDAAAWVNHVEATLAGIRGRGNTAIICGGTGLYFKALLEGLGESPAPDTTLRRELERVPLEELLDELRRKDPSMYERIDRENRRRVVRAVEVIRTSGRAYSTQRAAWTTRSGDAHASTAKRESTRQFFGLERERDDLRQRINQRVETMFRNGLVQETKRLMDQGLTENRTAMQAIGYRQVVEHLRGERSLEETVALVKQRTWQLARRQWTWFRRQLDLEWLMIQPGETPESVVARLLGKLRR